MKINFSSTFPHPLTHIILFLAVVRSPFSVYLLSINLDVENVQCQSILQVHALVSVPQEVLSTTETALAMNRYIGSALLPLLTRCAALFASTEHYAQLIDSTLQTIYRLSKGRSLTKAQRDAIEECLLAICK